MEFCVFSKHLQAYDYAQLGRALESIGVSGVDLTVRPKGHVEPAAVKDKLPEAVATLAREGVKVTMITTAITSLGDPDSRQVLETAASLGIQYFKFGYFPYQGFGTLKKSLVEANAKLRELAAFNKSIGIWGGYHNHASDCLGATVAHVNRLLDGTDPEGAGAFFDVAHAILEGTSIGWMQGLDDVAPRVRMIALKDFAIDMKPGQHFGKVVPMGTGLVQWKEYIRCIKTIVPQIGVASIHAEYDLPADEVLAQAAKDKKFFDKLWKAE